MLEAIRNRAQGIFAWIIVVLIVVPFAFVAFQDYLVGGKEAAPATVNGVEISRDRVDNAYQMQRQRLQEMLGANFRPELLDEASTKRRILDQFIERELLVQAAEKSGMRVGDGELAAYIQSIDAFQQDGKFSRELYQRILRAQNMNPAFFESEVRRDLLVEQLQQAVVSTEFLTASERDSYLRLIAQKRDVGYLLLPLDHFMNLVEVSDQEIQAHYDGNRSLYMNPEQVSVEYLELSRDELARGIHVTEDELAAYYEQHKGNYVTPEQRKASHILFAVQPGSDQSADEKALAEAKEILAKLRAGADFADLAKAHSDDPGSAQQGGDLGFFGKGVMDPAFETAVFSLNKGALSEPVRSAYGYHLIKVEDVRSGGETSLAQARDKVLGDVRNERAASLYADKLVQLKDLTYENPNSLQKAAEDVGLAIKHSPYFSRNGGSDPLGANPDVVKTAFSTEVLEEGKNSYVVTLGDDHVVVMRLRDRKPEAQQPLEIVKAQILNRLKREKSAETARAAADKVLAALKSGEKPESVAQSQGLEWVRKDGLGREATDADPTVVRTAFAMEKPQGTKPSFERIDLNNGGQAVVAVFQVRDGEKSSSEDKGRLSALEQANEAAAIQAFLKGLKEQADVKINADRL